MRKAVGPLEVSPQAPWGGTLWSGGRIKKSQVSDEGCIWTLMGSWAPAMAEVEQVGNIEERTDYEEICVISDTHTIKRHR